MAVIERLRGDGLRGKADFVLKKIADLRKADEIRRVNSQNEGTFRPMLIDEWFYLKTLWIEV